MLKVCFPEEGRLVAVWAPDASDSFLRLSCTRTSSHRPSDPLPLTLKNADIRLTHPTHNRHTHTHTPAHTPLQISCKPGPHHFPTTCFALKPANTLSPNARARSSSPKPRHVCPSSVWVREPLVCGVPSVFRSIPHDIGFTRTSESRGPAKVPSHPLPILCLAFPLW